MGFFDFVGEQLGNLKKKHNKYYDEYDRYPDEYLLRKFRNTSGIIEKNAIAKILKERGYTANDVK